MPGEQAPQPIGFDDIPALPDREIQMVLREVEARDIAVALTGADEALKAQALKNVSARVRDQIMEETGALGALKEEDVQEARLQITRSMRQLQSAGLIAWPPIKNYPLSADGAPQPAPRRRPRPHAKPVQPRISLLGLAGTLAGLTLLVLLLMWLASLQTKPTIGAKKSQRTAFKSAGGARQDGPSGAAERGQKEKDDEGLPGASGASQTEGKAPAASRASGVSQTEGAVSVTSGGGSERPADGAGLQAGDRVETGADGRAELHLPGEIGQVQMEANSSVQMGDRASEGEMPSELNVRAGNLLVRADKSALTVRSPLMEATASEGAVYRFRVVLDATTTVSVDRGTVWLKSLINAEVDRLVAGPGDEVTISPRGKVAIRKDVIKRPESGAK